MATGKLTATLFSLIAATTLAAESRASAQADTISGVYAADDGGSYYVRFVPSLRKVFWYGERANGDFANVWSGDVDPGSAAGTAFVPGTFQDVPKGSAPGGGTLSLVFKPSEITRIATSGFGATHWTRTSASTVRGIDTPRARFTGAGASGVYIGDDKGVYYVRQDGSKLSWFGNVCAANGASTNSNVFVGNVTSNFATGNWVDVPYGTTGNVNQLTFQIGSSALNASGTWAGRSWRRFAADDFTPVSTLELTLTTGGDDLREGSVAYLVLGLRSGERRINLNGGAGFANGSVHKFSVPLPVGTRAGDILSIGLDWDGAARRFPDGYDNWNLDTFAVGFTSSLTSCKLDTGVSYAPGRFTGGRTQWRASLDLL